MIAVIGVFIGTILKFNTSSNLSAFSKTYFSEDMVSEYASGIKGIRNGLDLIDSSPQLNSIECTLTDFFASMPVVSHLFPKGQSAGTIVQYQEYVGRKDVICPMIIQSIAHFGKIGAPVMSMIMAYLAISFNLLLNRTKNMYVLFACIELVFYCSLFFALNMMIIQNVLWTRWVFILLLYADVPVSLKTREKR